MNFLFEDLSVFVPNFPPPILSDDLQFVIGCALTDRPFHDLLLAKPRQALATFDLSPADRRAAAAIRGATSLAEYAARLEQRLAKAAHRRVVPRRPRSEQQRPVKVAS